MTHFLMSLTLCAVAVPAFGQEAPSQTTKLPYGYVVVEYQDGSRKSIPLEIAAQQAEIERIRVQAEADALADPTSNGSVVGRPAMTTPTNPEEMNVCGFGMNMEAFSGRKARKLAPYVPDCLEAQAKLVDAVGRKANAGAAITAKVPFHSDGDSTGVMDAAPIDALSDNDGGVNLGGFGLGTGVPYGASPFQAVQSAGLGWQAIQAGQLAPTSVIAPAAPVTPETRVVTKTVTREPTQEEIEAVVEARLKAAGQ